MGLGGRVHRFSRDAEAELRAWRGAAERPEIDYRRIVRDWKISKDGGDVNKLIARLEEAARAGQLVRRQN